MSTAALVPPRSLDVAASLGEPLALRARGAGTPTAGTCAHRVVSPYDGRTVALVPTCTPDDVDASCLEAERHLDDDLPQHRRAEVLSRAARALDAAREPFARIISLEAGKPVRAARVEVDRCVDTLRLSAAEALALSGEVVPMDATASGEGRIGFARRVPVGVVGAITPFNFPLNLVAHKVAPAVAAGCPVVLKPAPATPVSALAFAELLADAGLPEGWLSVVTGAGDELGTSVVAHRAPRLISFTGSVSVGWAIAAAAPRKRVCLELGANSPVIVEPDADVDLVAARVAHAAFGSAEQSCISVQRVLAHRDVAEALGEAIARRAEALVVGDPLGEATDVGPVIDAASAQRIVASVRQAEHAGARVLAAARRSGAWCAPPCSPAPPTRATCGPRRSSALSSPSRRARTSTRPSPWPTTATSVCTRGSSRTTSRRPSAPRGGSASAASS